MIEPKGLVLVLGLFIFLAYPELAEARGKKFQVVQACEGHRLKLSCPEGTLIKVVEAGYGRRNASVCYLFDEEDPDFEFCQSPFAFDIIRAFCDGHKTCTLKATNHNFQDPCPGQVKYAEATYTCIKTERYELYRKRKIERLQSVAETNQLPS